MMNDTYAVEARDIYFKYSQEGPLILNGVNIRIKKGQLTGILGLSGCGKSTLANILCGIIPKSVPGILEGMVYINSEEIGELSLAKTSQRIGMVFQEPDHMLFLPTAEEEIAFGPENLCIEPKIIIDTIEEILETLNIEYLRDKNPSILSGGEKRILAIGTVLSMNTDIIILDEPYAELDEENRIAVMGIVEKLRDLKKTIIIIEHNLDCMKNMDNLFIMKNGTISTSLEGEEVHEFLQSG